jgi:hypothetical protein
MYKTTVDEVSSRAIKVAKSAAVSLDDGIFSQIYGLESDLGTPAYESIKKRMIELVDINTDVAFAYVFLPICKYYI